ncbi:MAG: right-handed parallel beta-helix repeat-containing protein, partial [Planctomycetota bacterium]
DIITLTNCRFVGNEAGQGAGLYNTGVTATLTNCSFSGNMSYGPGGGMHATGEITLTDCAFNGNTSYGPGGGLYAPSIYQSNLTNCIFAGNKSKNAHGGGVLVAGGPTWFTNCTIVDNSSRSPGGGMYISGGSPTLSRCRISGNSVRQAPGGGIYHTGGLLKIFNSIISGNSTGYGMGGGMYSNAGLELGNCTFTGNSARNAGGALYYTGPSTSDIDNCIFWGDRPNEISGYYGPVSNCCVQGGWPGLQNIEEDPGFVQRGGRALDYFSQPNYYYDPSKPLDNCWIEGDYHLLPWSPCIDAGYDIYEDDDDDNDKSAKNVEDVTDFEGNPRERGLRVDIGAYEAYPNSFIFYEYHNGDDDKKKNAKAYNYYNSGMVSVLEGDQWYLGVSLAQEPRDIVEVVVTFVSGDGDLECASRMPLAFDANNYSLPQFLTFTAAEDDDFWADEAEFEISAPGLEPTAIKVYSWDNDWVPQAGTTVIHVDKNATGAGDGTSWADAFTDIQTAVEAAELVILSGYYCEIHVAQGVYTPAPPDGDRTASFALTEDISILGGYAGVTEDDPNERDIENYRTILSGDLNGNDTGEVDPFNPTRSDNSYHVISARYWWLYDTDADLYIDGVTITGGNANGPGMHSEGGAIAAFIDYGQVSNCFITGNCALTNGGAISIGAPGEFYLYPTLLNCEFENNYAVQRGGAISMIAYDYMVRSAFIQDCSFDGNRSKRGGAIYNAAGAFSECYPEVYNCTFTGNSAEYGGAIYNTAIDGRLIPLIQDCNFTANTATEGGAAYSYAMGEQSAFEATFDRCDFAQNQAEHGGGFYTEGYRAYSRNLLTECIFTENQARYRGGGLYADFGGAPVLDDCTFTDNAPSEIGTGMCAVEIYGDVLLGRYGWDNKEETYVRGSGTIRLQADSVFRVAKEATIRCNISGPGLIFVSEDAELTIANDAVIDLSDESEPSIRGAFDCWGLLRLRDTATVRNAEIKVNRADFGGDVRIFNSVITAEAGAPYGQFFVQNGASIIGNDIHADGDRIMDLDPTAFEGLIANNRIFVTITEGVGDTRGGLLELRGRPDLAGGGVCESHTAFLCNVAAVPDFDPNSWALEELRLIDEAKVNLTNRFDFQFPFDEGGEDEVLYVRNLYLGAGAVLNTCFNKIYYQNLYADPCSIVENVPLLGFSLNNIAFDDEIDYLTRVTHNNFFSDVNDDYHMMHVERIEANEPDPNGMMRMTNIADPDPCSPTSGVLFNARAKGLFARANEELLLVTFEYLFETDDPDVELVVYLTDVPILMAHDDPNRPDHYIEMARLASPPSSRPGSFGSGRFGVFYAYVERGHLDFLRGTRIELELIGAAGSSVLINNWDPQVHCNPLYCGDITGDWGATQLDYLTVLAHVGCRSALPHDSGASLTCMDAGFGSDGYVDAVDAQAWDWRLNLPNPHFCDMPLIPTKDAKSAVSLKTAKIFSEPDVYPSEGLLISGKRSAEKLADRHYILDSEGEYIASVDPAFIRANGRLIKDIAGGLYQINLAEGLVRLSDGAAIVPPAAIIIDFNEPRYDAAAEVRIGMHYEDYEWSGCPVFDAAFDPDGEHVYAAPVVIAPDGEEPYQAVAKLRLLDSGIPPYEIVQIYDDAPLPGDNQYLDNLREIEIDDSGNLYVTNT